MKKALILLVSLFVFSGDVAFAQEMGNPAQLIKQGQFDVGFQWNSVFKQGFEDYDLKRTYSDGVPRPPFSTIRVMWRPSTSTRAPGSTQSR